VEFAHSTSRIVTRDECARVDAASQRCRATSMLHDSMLLVGVIAMCVTVCMRIR
jgi:hypothetical protein